MVDADNDGDDVILSLRLIQWFMCTWLVISYIFINSDSESRRTLVSGYFYLLPFLWLRVVSIWFYSVTSMTSPLIWVLPFMDHLTLRLQLRPVLHGPFCPFLHKWTSRWTSPLISRGKLNGLNVKLGKHQTELQWPEIKTTDINDTKLAWVLWEKRVPISTKMYISVSLMSLVPLTLLLVEWIFTEAEQSVQHRARRWDVSQIATCWIIKPL